MSTRSSVSTTCSDSGDEDSAGITTTGLMCSESADARRKLRRVLAGRETRSRAPKTFSKVTFSNDNREKYKIIRIIGNY